LTSSGSVFVTVAAPALFGLALGQGASGHTLGLASAALILVIA
jgi:hypothetical protein